MTFLRRFGILTVGLAVTLVGVAIGAYDVLKPVAHEIDRTTFPTAAELAESQQAGAPYDDAPTIWIAVGLVIVLVGIGLVPAERLGDRAPILRAAASVLFGAALITLGVIIGASPYLPNEPPDPHAVNINVVQYSDPGPLAFSLGDPHSIVTFAVILLGCVLVAGAVGYVIGKRRALLPSPR